MPPNVRTALFVALGACTAVVATRSLGASEQRVPEVSSTTHESTTPDRNERELRATRERLAKLQRALEELSTRDESAALEPLRARLSELETRLASLGRAGERADDSARGLNEDDRRAVERARTDLLVASLEEHFDGEARNEAWARPTESAIVSTLREATGAVPSAVQCQARLCKVEMVHADKEAEDLAMHNLVHVRALGDTEAFSERQEREDGSIRTLTFLTGGGTHLPEPPAI